MSDHRETGSGAPDSESGRRERPPIIAIDGPSGAGKGTIARAVAARLGFRHIDTGAMYRALAWKAIEEQTDPSDEPAVSELAGRSRFEVGDGRIHIDGHDVAAAIRNPRIDSSAAIVARHPRVREALIARQRELGGRGGVVMEGRDIGTVVFPAAEVKIFLDASPEERARRRAADPAHASGQGTAGIPDVATALAERDRIDRSRPTSPLVQARDAVVIDTTRLSIDEAVERVLDVVRKTGV